MKFRLFLTALTFSFLLTALWVSGSEPVVTNVTNLHKVPLGPASEITFRKLSVESGSNKFGVQLVTFSRFDVRARLVDQPVSRLSGSNALKDLMKPDDLFGINGGYFSEGFGVEGWHVQGGVQKNPFSLKPVLSGVVHLTKRGGLEILHRNAAPKRPWSAIQSGPFLVDPGGLMGINPSPSSNSKSRRRSVLFSDGKGMLGIAVSTPATLYELAEAFLKKPELFGMKKVERVLNLDGGPSTAMIVRLPGGEIADIREAGPVRNYLLFSPAKNSLR